MLTNPLSSPSGGTPGGGTPQGETPTTSGTGETPQPTTLTSVEDANHEIERLKASLKRANAESKSNRELLEAKLKTEQDAEQQRLKQQGQFEELAKQHESRVKELEPIATRYSALAELVSEQIKAETKDWPASVRALDPGKDAPIEERMAWKNRAAAIVAELQTTARGTLPGNRPNPSPAGQPSREELIAANRKDLQKSRTYGI